MIFSVFSVFRRTNLRTVGTFNNAQWQGPGSQNTFTTVVSGGIVSDTVGESIYDSVPDTPEEEDIYGSLVAYQKPPRPPTGSGFAGLPEKLGHVVAELVETEKNYVDALSVLSEVKLEGNVSFVGRLFLSESVLLRTCTLASACACTHAYQ